MEQLTADLEDATRQLRRSSGDVDAALGTVARLALQTRMLAINASIEASRAGEHGRPFGVVVEEVQRLADHSSATTSEIEQRMEEMRLSISRVASMTACDGVPAVEPAPAAGDVMHATVALANQQIHAMAESAGQQLGSADTLDALGTDVRAAGEALLLAVGTFRFQAHQRAGREMSELVAEFATTSLSRRPLEIAMERWIERHPHFELVYVTNAAGQQITDNIARAGRHAVHDAGYGRDRSSRPWYRAAVASDAICSTDLYRSSATGDFCFTISVALRDAEGLIRAVLAADVNFQELLT